MKTTESTLNAKKNEPPPKEEQGHTEDNNYGYSAKEGTVLNNLLRTHDDINSKHKEDSLNLGETIRLECNKNLAKTYNVLKNFTPMGHKGHYQRVLLKKDVCSTTPAPSPDSSQSPRSQSLPDCSSEEVNGCLLQTDDIPEQDNACCSKDDSLDNDTSSMQSPTKNAENRFKTWPERCEKFKNNSEHTLNNSPEKATDRISNDNTPLKKHGQQNCDNNLIFVEKNGSMKAHPTTKLSFNEALQNISLAYSPVTKQLHFVQGKPVDVKIDFDKTSSNSAETSTTNGINKVFDSDEEDCTLKIVLDEETKPQSGNLEGTSDRNTTLNKKGHKRDEAGSFSSTISSLSDPSPSGSLLDADERSLASFDDSCGGLTSHNKRKGSLTNFFQKNVFSWKSGSSSLGNSNVWKLFGKSSNGSRESLSGSSPSHRVVVASSTALIQHARPSNLPAKTQEEEHRHREEYKLMVENAKKKEAQHTAAKQKLQKLQLEQEEQQALATRHFLKNVLPNWDGMRSNKKTRDLWWQGLPSSIRGKVWRLAIGNELNITQELYKICLSRAQNRIFSKKIEDKGDDHHRSHEKSNFNENNTFLQQNCHKPENNQNSLTISQQIENFENIQLDISRTFPHLCIFQNGGPYSEILHTLLAAYVCYKPEIGYVQGMSYIAAILILNMDAYDAFVCFANLLNAPLHLAAFQLNQERIECYYRAYNEIFSYNLPKLFRHFEMSNLTPDLYLLDWIYTIYAKAMPLDVACRVWDVFLRDGLEFIFRTALGILHLNQEILIDMDFLHGAQFLTHLPDDLSSDQLFKSIQTVSTNIAKQNFSQIVEKYVNKKNSPFCDRS